MQQTFQNLSVWIKQSGQDSFRREQDLFTKNKGSICSVSDVVKNNYGVTSSQFATQMTTLVANLKAAQEQAQALKTSGFQLGVASDSISKIEKIIENSELSETADPKNVKLTESPDLDFDDDETPELD